MYEFMDPITLALEILVMLWDAYEVNEAMKRLTAPATETLREGTTSTSSSSSFFTPISRSSSSSSPLSRASSSHPVFEIYLNIFLENA